MKHKAFDDGPSTRTADWTAENEITAGILAAAPAAPIRAEDWRGPVDTQRVLVPARVPTSIDFRAIILGLLDDPEVVAKLRRKIDLPTVEPANDYETVAETAKRYRLSTRTIRRALAVGLPHERPVGRRVRIPVSKARAWFESGKGRKLGKR